jgi:hypothetical protein
MEFKFAVGQAVEYKPIGGNTGLFTVVRRMPEEHGAVDRKYRIKSVREGFERSVLECDLSPSDKPESMYDDVLPTRRNGGHR